MVIRLLPKLLWAASLPFLMFACKQEPAASQVASKVVEGKTMGTYYRVTYRDSLQRDFRASFDSLLEVINLEVSTYIPNSTISLFNQAKDTFDLSYNPVTQANDYGNAHFLANFEASGRIAEQLDYYFDPTVMPLVNYWGFGYTEKKPVTSVDSVAIDSLDQLVGFEKLQLLRSADRTLLVKSVPGVQLDFSAIAKGYAVDQLGQLLSDKGIQHYLVDIGGEVVAKGKSQRGDAWQLGINVPKEDAAVNEVQVVVPLQDQGLATSGNYRNFYEVDGKKYSHTINPKTGFPERSILLSASIFAKDCMTADAFATGFMVVGLDRAFEIANQTDGIEACFIYSEPDGSISVKYTPALADIFVDNQ